MVVRSCRSTLDEFKANLYTLSTNSLTLQPLSKVYFKDEQAEAKLLAGPAEDRGVLTLRTQPRIQRNFSLVACCLLYTSPSPRDRQKSRMPSSA